MADLPGVLDRARAAGVATLIAVGTDAADGALVCELARAHPGVHAAVAIHPNEVAQAAPGDDQVIAELARLPGVVAIGETGLDRYWDRTPFAAQQAAFDRHLDLAAALGLPVIIHCRDAYPDVIAQLAGRGGPIRGVLHSFTGDQADAEALLDLGLHLSFAGMITFTNRNLDPLREVARRTPADRLLVETDSPYLSPHPFRGKPNEPARTAITAATLAALRGLDESALADLTTANARALFALPPA
jgi:TatD DNase family protein